MKKLVVLLIIGFIFATLPMSANENPSAKKQFALKSDNSSYVAVFTIPDFTMKTFQTNTRLYMLECENWHQNIVLPKPDIVAINRIEYVDKSGTRKILPKSEYKLIKIKKTVLYRIEYSKPDKLPKLNRRIVARVLIYFETKE